MNLESINKWLDEEYGVSYTRLEELHDFVVEQDLKHREEKDKEIDKLKLHIIAIKEAISTWNLGYEEGYNEFKIPKKIMDVVWGDKE